MFYSVPRTENQRKPLRDKILLKIKARAKH
jgi:hypothetical protein